jgi:hypothetical protein
MKARESHIKRVLVPRARVRAAEFINELGHLMYEGKWSPVHVSHFNSENPRNRLDQITRKQSLCVVGQLIEAARTGIAETEILLTEQCLSEIFPEEEESQVDPELFSVLHHWDEPYPPSPGYYAINTAYWRDAFRPDDVDWTTSLVKLPVECIMFPEYLQGTREAAERDNANRFTPNVPLYVADPNNVLASACEIPPVPSAELVSRYRTTQAYFWAELIAVAWRLLATVSAEKDDRGLNARLVKQIQNYVEVLGLYEHGDDRAPSDAMLKNIVSQILHQWRGGVTDTPVLVSPSPARNEPKVWED